MSQFTTVPLNNAAAQNRDFVPVSNAQNVTRWQHKAGISASALFPKLSQSTRQGQSANAAIGQSRVKRKTVVKLQLPYETGFSFDDGTPRYDTIDMEVTSSVPVDASTTNISDAIAFIKGYLANVAFEDATKYGETPY